MDNQFHSTQQEQPRIQNYQVVSLLGQGGMGKVYKAVDLKTREVVAVKILLAKNRMNMNNIRRFFKEVHVISQLNHPNIIRLVDSGQKNGIPYFVMDFIDGITLREWLEQKISLRKRLAMIVKVAQAVDYAHQSGIIHRDLKPDNIMIDENNEPCVMDFGLAKFSEDIDNLTQTGGVIGTFHYMSPEQAEGRKHEIDCRTDIYALGAILYQCITKNPPFVGENASSIIKQICCNPVIPPSQQVSTVPKDMDKICLKALAKNPQDRYQNLTEFINDIEAFQSGKKIKTRIPQQRSPLTILVTCMLLITTTLVIALLSLPQTSTVPQKEIISVYYKLKSDIATGISIENSLKKYHNKWQKFPFFHQKIAELYFHYSFIDDTKSAQRLTTMKKHIDIAIHQQSNPYNILLLYKYYWIKGEVPQSVFRQLVTQQNDVVNLLPLYDKSQSPIDFIQEHVRQEWLQAINFAQKVKSHKIAHIIQPFAYYHYLPKDTLFDNYSLWVRGKRVSKINEAVYIAGIVHKKLHYLAIRSNRKLIEVYIDLDTLEVIGYKDLGNTPRVKGAKVNWERLGEALEIMNAGFVKNFCKKGYTFLFPHSKKYSQKPSPVTAHPNLKKWFHLNVDLNNLENSLYLFYKRRPISVENEFVMAAGLANNKVVYIAMTPNAQIKEIHYDFHNNKKIQDNLVVQLNKANMEESVLYLRYAFLGQMKDLGYIPLVFKNK